MGDNYFANWTSSDDEEQKRRAWEALAARSAPDIHQSLAQPVQLPEVNIQGARQAPDMDFTTPDNLPPDFAPEATDNRIPPERNTDLTPSTDAQASPDMPPDAGPQRPVREPPVVTPGTDAVDSPEMPPDAPKLAQLGAALSKRDLRGDAPAPPPPDSTPVRHSSSEDTGPSFGGTALAALADVLLNRGRGVGSILALSGEANSPKEKAKLDLLRAQAEHLRNPSVDPTTMAYKQAMLDLQREREKRMIEQGGTRTDLQRQNIENTQNRFDTKWNAATDPNSALNRTKVEVAGQTAGAGAAGRINTEHALNDVVAGDKAQIGGAEVAARLGATHDMAPVTNADEAAKAAAVVAAQSDPKLAYEQRMNEVLADRSNNGIGAGLSVEGLIKDNPGLEFTNPDQMQRAMKTRQINAKTLDQLMAANRAREILDSMYKTISDYQHGDLVDPQAYYGASKQLESHAQEYAGMMGRISGTSNQEQNRTDVARVPNLTNPMALEGVKRLWDAAQSNIKGNLGTLGVRAHAPSFAQPSDAQGTPGSTAIDTTNPTPSASPAKGDYSNYSRDTSDPPSLGRAAAPKPPQDAMQGTNVRPRKVTKPNGKVVTETLSDEDAATIASHPGWRVE